MKKLFFYILLMCLSLFLPALTLRADMGPKSSLEINIIGVDEPYTFELLFFGTLPDALDRDNIYQDRVNYVTYEFPEMIKDFNDEGYISTVLYRGRPTFQKKLSAHSFIYTYVPPKTFKLLILFNDGTYLTSNVETTKLFDSKITWDLTNVNKSISQTNVGVVNENLPIARFSYDLSLRIILTIGIEIVILYAFAYRLKKSYHLILLTNIVTQITLTLFMFSMRYFYQPFFGEIFVLVIGEIIIFTLESFIYMKWLTEKPRKFALIYALLANFASLAVGILLMISLWF